MKHFDFKGQEIFRKVGGPLLVGALYFLTGRIGVYFAIPPGVATPFWLPSGVAVLGALLLGYEVWPGIFLGSLAVNIITLWDISTWNSLFQSMTVIVFIAIGSTVQALIGGYLIKKWVPGIEIWEKVTNFFRFLGIAILICLIAATIGNLALSLVGMNPWKLFWGSWVTWWLGDFGGLLLILPLSLLFQKDEKFIRGIKGWLEFLIFLVLLTGVLIFLFNDLFIYSAQGLPLSFLMLPFLIWCGFRFGRKGMVLTLWLIIPFSISGTVMGQGPFAVLPTHQALLLFQLFGTILKVTGLLLSIAIWEQRKAENLLREGEERTRTILDNALDAVLGMDEGGKVRFWSPQAEQIFGWTSEEILGKSLSQKIIPLRYRADHEKGLRYFLATGKGKILGRRIEFSALRKSGKEFPVELTISPLHLNGKYFFSAFLRDITDRKQAEQELRQLVEETQKLSQRKTEFASIVSHELRTPLTVIKDNVDMVRMGVDGPVTPEQEATLVIAMENVDRLVRLINNVLDLEKLESGKLELVLGPSSFHQVLEKTIQFMELHAKKRGVDLILDSPDPLVIFRCDEDKMKAVMINLIENALKYSPAGGRIWVRMRREEDKIILEVEDEGVGIEKGDQAHVFEIFRQGSKPALVNVGGAGVGLALCKWIVSLHQGEIVVESEQGKGTLFQINLPYLS